MTLNIIIVDNNNEHLSMIKDTILKRIQINPTVRPYDAQITMCTNNAHEAVKYIQKCASNDFLAILDINLNGNMNGIEIAKRLRALTGFIEICYISAHTDFLLGTIKSNTSPIDFITKDSGLSNIVTQLRKVLDLAYTNYTKLLENQDINNVFTYEPLPGIIKTIPMDEILFIKTTKKQHRLQLVCKNKVIEFQGELKSLENKKKNFLRIDRQILVNLQNIKSIDTKTRRLSLGRYNQKEVYCKISYRKLALIKKFILSY